MTPDELAAIEERANAATWEPWVQDEGDPRGVVFLPIKDEDGDTDVINCRLWANARFIAHARTDVPALRSYVRELEAIVLNLADIAQSNLVASLKQGDEMEQRIIALKCENVLLRARVDAFGDLKQVAEVIVGNNAHGVYDPGCIAQLTDSLDIVDAVRRALEGNGDAA